MHDAPPAETRRKGTRSALLAAFRELVLTRRYRELKVSQVIARAGVARSTFYAHFGSKDELLMAGVAEPLGALADAVQPDAKLDDLASALQHLWENRGVARSLLGGPLRTPLARLLTDMIERRLGPTSVGTPPAAPVRLIARHIAGAQLAILLAWVSGEASCSSRQLAAVIRSMTQGGLSALAASPPY